MSTDTFVERETVNLDYAATVLVASQHELATVPTKGPITEGGYANGQRAWCASTKQLFILQPAVGTADGRFIIATPDDATRQWVLLSVVDGGTGRILATTLEVDLTVAQTFNIIPPINFRAAAPVNLRVFITQKDGTVTTAPTLQSGANAAINDLNASSTTAAFVTQALDTVVSPLNVVSPSNVMDLSTFGLRVQITSGAVLGTATVFKGRFFMEVTIF